MENWRPVRDGRNRLVKGYEVSDRGRVRTFLVPGQKPVTDRSRPKAVFLDRAGFPNVSLRSKTGAASVHVVHLLVAVAFLGTRPSKRHCVIHLNSAYADNRVKNLKWVTRTEASRHSMRERPRRGPAKLTLKDVKWIRASPLPVKTVAKKYKVAVQTIYLIRKRLTWKDERET